MAANIVPFAQDAEDPGDADVTDRLNKLYDWADKLLQRLGYAAKVAAANGFDDLRKIVLDVDDADITLAVRDALHPASGRQAKHFVGLNAGALKGVLKSRLNNMKKKREAELLRGPTAGAAGAKRYTNWTNSLKFDDKGNIRPILANLILYLRHHPKWQGVLAFDEFNNRVVIRKRPYWGDEAPDTLWTDHHESHVRVWFQNEDIIAAQGDVGRAVQAAARSNPFHPVHDYFDALVWDGTPRLDTWLITYLHADNTDYARAIGPRFLISAVARIYKPGCQVDHMLILEGPQGKLKSQALRALAIKDGWFTDRLSHLASKDAAIEIAGVLLVEIAELDALTKASASTSKSFITQRFDRFRPPYGKHLTRLQRQCVFAGTINPPVGGYLKDTTGNRRFWPVACHGMIDRDGIERDRDQLWAEAIARYKAGAKWFLETPELEALATVEQAARFKADVWKETVVKWIGKRKNTSVEEVLERALKITPQDQNRAAQMRVASILTDLKFDKYRPRTKNGKRENRYWRE